MPLSCDPRPGRGVKTLPGSKSQERVSTRVFGGVSKGPDFWLAESPGDSFLTLFGGVGQDPPETPSETLFLLFEPGRVLTPLPGGGDRNPFLNGLFSRVSRGKMAPYDEIGEIGKRPMKEGKRPNKVMVLVGIPVGCLMGCFRAPRRGGKQPL